MKTKALAETCKHWSSKWFSENVSNVIIGRYTLDVHEALLYDVVYGVTSCGVFGDSLTGVRLQRRGDLDLFV